MSDGGELDLSSLLAPFPGANAGGEDPRADESAQSLYRQLRDARSEARAAERAVLSGSAPAKGQKDGPDPPAKWRRVRELGFRLLSERAKDLEVAAWLTEALVRQAGIHGMAACSRLMAGLVEAFWPPSLYPSPDEDGVATTVAPIMGLNGTDREGTLLQPLHNSIMFQPASGDPVTFWQYSQAEAAAQGPPRGGISFADLDRQARSVEPAHFAALRDDFDVATQEWTRLGALLDAKAGRNAPSVSRVREWLETMLVLVERYAPARTEAVTVVLETETVAVTIAGGTNMPEQAKPAAEGATREDMLRELARIAAYFRRAEPQSPLSLTLEEAIRRAKLSWPELLQEIIPNVEQRNSMLTVLGIRPPKEM